MTTEEKLKLIKEVGEEIVTEKELKSLFDSGEKLIAYDGFEPSGEMHIAQGILRTINVNKMTKTGVKFKMLVADWHAWANKKMGGDLDKIQTVGKYFIEIWRSCGMDMDNVEFIWASDLVKNTDYWKLVLQIAGTNSINRFIRTAEIMGRSEKDELTAAQLIYPCMQAADIFTLGAKITQLGMDQRKVNVLAREIGNQLGFWKPVIVSHHMLMGLQKPGRQTGQSKRHPEHSEGSSTRASLDSSTASQNDKIARVIELKMSKSNPDSAIFMTDSKDDIERKLNKAWCPEGVVKENPVLEYVRYIIFESFDKFTVERNERFGGDITFDSYEDLEKAYKKKEVHPQDLKTSVGNKLNELLTPVREHFQKNPYAKNLLTQVQSFEVTR